MALRAEVEAPASGASTTGATGDGADRESGDGESRGCGGGGGPAGRDWVARGGVGGGAARGGRGGGRRALAGRAGGGGMASSRPIGSTTGVGVASISSSSPVFSSSGPAFVAASLFTSVLRASSSSFAEVMIFLWPRAPRILIRLVAGRGEFACYRPRPLKKVKELQFVRNSWRRSRSCTQGGPPVQPRRRRSHGTGRVSRSTGIPCRRCSCR